MRKLFTASVVLLMTIGAWAQMPKRKATEFGYENVAPDRKSVV